MCRTRNSREPRGHCRHCRAPSSSVPEQELEALHPPLDFQPCTLTDAAVNSLGLGEVPESIWILLAQNVLTQNALTCTSLQGSRELLPVPLSDQGGKLPRVLERSGEKQAHRWGSRQRCSPLLSSQSGADLVPWGWRPNRQSWQRDGSEPSAWEQEEPVSDPGAQTAPAAAG